MLLLLPALLPRVQGLPELLTRAVCFTKGRKSKKGSGMAGL
jgi:hypothetical protein